MQDAETEGAYDVRHGARGYSPVVAAFGALTVPTIFIVFTTDLPSKNPTMAVFAAGLLVVALLGTLGGAIAMAAIGAERAPTGNLAICTMWAGAGVVVALTSLMGAIQALASYFLPSAAVLFGLMVQVTGLVGVAFVSFAVGDSWMLGPRDPEERRRWRSTQWIKSQAEADRRALQVALVGLVPVALGVVLTLSAGEILVSPVADEWSLVVGTDPDQLLRWTNFVVGIGVIVVLATAFTSLLASRHTQPQRGLKPVPAYAAVLIASLYTLVLAGALPLVDHLSGLV